MQRMSARDAKNGFGRFIDIARAEPVAIEKHGRVVVIAFEEYERLAGIEGTGNEPMKGESRPPKGKQ